MLTFIRHAEALHNVVIEYTDRNPALTDTGLAQSQQLNGSFDLVLCSPLKRTMETLRHSHIQYQSIEICKLLREHVTESADLFEEEMEFIESEGQLLERLKLLKDHIMKTESYKNKKPILLITHSDLIWYFSSQKKTFIQDGSEVTERFGTWVENAGIHEMDHETFEKSLV
jgi:broad specificity phosphatase PhoE